MTIGNSSPFQGSRWLGSFGRSLGFPESLAAEENKVPEDNSAPTLSHRSFLIVNREEAIQALMSGSEGVEAFNQWRRNEPGTLGGSPARLRPSGVSPAPSG